MNDPDVKSSADKLSPDEEETLGLAKHIDLANNVQARYVCFSSPLIGLDVYFRRIQNPLRNIPRHKLLEQVETFVTEKGLQDKTDLFKKAALLAQNPKDFERLDDLTEDDKAIIRRETTRAFFFFPSLSLTDVENHHPTPCR